ncbi:hypothetical protein MGSAQ_000415 [marine sediment metagenome]|uniref:Uncharacterized protein n=1 Tax=marine sediment metagenome TaxID=412755 RepID=A0A1B6NXC3_9ZZZZ
MLKIALTIQSDSTYLIIFDVLCIDSSKRAAYTMFFCMLAALQNVIAPFLSASLLSPFIINKHNKRLFYDSSRHL